MTKQRKQAAEGKLSASAEASFELSSRHPRVFSILDAGCRLLVMAVAALGINLLMGDALRAESHGGEMVIPILFWLAVLTLFYHVKKGALWGIGLLLAGGVLVWYRTGEDPIRYLSSGVAYLWNRVMSVVDAKGYMSLPSIGEGLTLTSEAMYVVVSLLSCMMLYLAIRRKTRLFLAVGYLLLISAPLFVYDLPLRNDGAALILASVAGMIVMRFSERHTENGNSSGFVGATVALLSFLLLLVPMLRVNEPWREITAFSGKLEEIRQVITDLAMGKNPFGSFGSGGEEEPENGFRDASASDRHFTGKHLFSVYSGTVYDVYLRDWVGGTYEDSRWYLPELDGLDESLRPVSEEDEYYHVTLLVLGLLETLEGRGADECAERLGLFRGSVGVRPADKRAGIPVPAGMISPLRSPYGEGLFPPYRFTSDFLYTCGDLSSDTPYEADVLLPVRFTTADYEALVEAIYSYRGYVAGGVMPEEGTLGYKMARLYGRYGLAEALAFLTARDRQAATLYRDKVANDAIDRAVLDLFAKSDIKRYYSVMSGETESSGENGVITLREENGETVTYYLSSEAEVLFADEVAFAVASYLRENYRYSLTPDADASLEAMEDFLYGSGEGYCVQFATAATLMMRRLGFTARYAEGFIAREFTRNGDGDFQQRYVTKVRDRHAHAWAEFWVPGYGWRILEATPGYSENFFQETTETDPPGIIDPPIITPITFPPDTETTYTDPVTEIGTDTGISEYPPETAPFTEDENELPPETTGEGASPAPYRDKAPYLVGVLLILLLTGFLLVKRGRRYLRQRLDRIAKAKAGCSDGERERLAAALARDLTVAFGVYRLLPEGGESPTDFGKRADKTLSPDRSEAAPSRGILALSRRIYGGVTDASDLMAMALVTENLMKQAPRRLGILRFLLYRWILCRI